MGTRVRAKPGEIGIAITTRLAAANPANRTGRMTLAPELLRGQRLEPFRF